MINKDFKRDWNVFGGEVNLLIFKHWELSIDKDSVGVAIDISFRYHFAYIKLLWLVIRIF